jgi:hypothetical protein
VVACCLLPPSGPVELVPHPIRSPAVSRAAIPMIFRNMILSIMAEGVVGAQPKAVGETLKRLSAYNIWKKVLDERKGLGQD